MVLVLLVPSRTTTMSLDTSLDLDMPSISPTQEPLAHTNRLADSIPDMERGVLSLPMALVLLVLSRTTTISGDTSLDLDMESNLLYGELMDTVLVREVLSLSMVLVLLVPSRTTTMSLDTSLDLDMPSTSLTLDSADPTSRLADFTLDMEKGVLSLLAMVLLLPFRMRTMFLDTNMEHNIPSASLTLDMLDHSSKCLESTLDIFTKEEGHTVSANMPNYLK